MRTSAGGENKAAMGASAGGESEAAVGVSGGRDMRVDAAAVGYVYLIYIL